MILRIILSGERRELGRAALKTKKPGSREPGFCV